MEKRTIYGDMCRFLQAYGWEWGIVHKVINRWHNTCYTIPELKAFYQLHGCEQVPP